jgi:hypothetical protein
MFVPVPVGSHVHGEPAPNPHEPAPGGAPSTVPHP